MSHYDCDLCGENLAGLMGGHASDCPYHTLPQDPFKYKGHWYHWMRGKGNSASNGYKTKKEVHASLARHLSESNSNRQRIMVKKIQELASAIEDYKAELNTLELSTPELINPGYYRIMVEVKGAFPDLGPRVNRIRREYILSFSSMEKAIQRANKLSQNLRTEGSLIGQVDESNEPVVIRVGDLDDRTVISGMATHY